MDLSIQYTQEGAQYDQVRRKLAEAKLARKNAEEDAKMLKNRINMLRMEQEKATKKIEDTHKKALDIVSIKQQNISVQEKKLEQQIKKKKDTEQKTLSNKSKKEMTMYNIKSKKEQHEEAKFRTTSEIKQELQVRYYIGIERNAIYYQRARAGEEEIQEGYN